jgi:hypothetical protein
MNHDNDVMRRLAAARPDDLAPDPGARSRMLEAVLAGRAQPVRDRRRTMSRPMLGLVGLAAAVAAVVLAAQLAPGAWRSAVGRGIVGVGPGTTEPASPDVLLVAARHVNPNVATGRYWHISEREDLLVLGGRAPDTYLVDIPDLRDRWFGMNATDHDVMSEQLLGATPLTTADVAAWRRAGAHDPIEVPLGTGTMSREPDSPWIIGLNPGLPFWVGGLRLTVSDLWQLPDDPGRLAAFLRAQYAVLAPGDPPYVDQWLFQTATELLTEPVRPSVRAATFRMLAGIPGVRSLGKARDWSGRVGAGVRLEAAAYPQGGLVEQQLIVDLSTGNLLASQWVVVRPGGRFPWAHPGMRVSSLMTLAAGWTDDMAPPPNHP